MPPRIRLIGRFGNALAVLLFGALGLFAGDHGPPGMTFLMLALAALSGFNLYAIEHAAGLLSEEEWLKSEVRKAELRQRLQTLSTAGAASSTPPSSNPGQSK
jgi:hypothetical protein